MPKFPGTTVLCSEGRKAGPTSPRSLMRAWLLAALAVIAAASSIGSIAVEAAEVPSHYQGDGGVLRLPTNANSTQLWHLAAIEKYRLDKKYGFELQLVPAATRQMTITAIESRGADIGNFSWIDIVRLRNGGTKIVGVIPFLSWGTNQIVVPAASPVRTFADLRGKKLGVASITDLDWVLVRSIAKGDYQLDAGKDFTVQQGAIGLIRGLVETSQLDAAIMWNDQTPAMVTTGKARIIYELKDMIAGHGLPATPMLIYAASTDYAEAHPQNIRAFAAAYREAVDLLRHDDSIWLEQGKTRAMTPEAVAALRDEMRRDLMTEFKPTTMADIQTLFQYLLPRSEPEIFGFSQLPNDYLTLDYQ